MAEAEFHLRGTCRAFSVLGKLIKKWETTRSGCLEQFAEYVTKNETTIDVWLDEMVRRGALKKWRLPAKQKASDLEISELWTIEGMDAEAGVVNIRQVYLGG